MPRKWCEGLLRRLPPASPAAGGGGGGGGGGVGFVCFNTRGVPGSGARHDFAHKTLTGDLEDLELVCGAQATVAASRPRRMCGVHTMVALVDWD